MRKGMFGRVAAAGIVGAVVVLSATAFAALPEGATPLTYIVGNKGARMYLDTEWTLQPDKDVFDEDKNLLTSQACYWSRKWLPTPVLLPGESHGQRSLVTRTFPFTPCTQEGGCAVCGSSLPALRSGGCLQAESQSDHTFPAHLRMMLVSRGNSR